MAKDAKGHGSDKRGESGGKNPESSFTPWPKGTRFVKGTLSTPEEMRASGLNVTKSDTYAAGARGVAKEHNIPTDHLNAWGQTPAVAKAVRAQLRMGRKMQLNKPPSQRRHYP